MSFKPATYAPFLAACLVVWPIIAYMGAQGYTGAVAVAALLGLIYVRVKDVRAYAVAIVAFVLWVIVAGFRSPESQALLSGDLLSGSFSMEQAGIRFVLTALAGLGVMVATWAVAAGTSRVSLGVIVGAAIAQFLGVVVTALFMPQILDLLAPFSDPISEMPQNIMRNANSFFLLLPFLLAWTWHRSGSDYGPIISIAIGIISFAAFLQTGTETALSGTLIMLTFMAIVKVWPRNGFRIIFSGLAVYIVTAPALLGWGLSQLRASGIPLPDSFFSRTYSWELVRTKIAESPFIGHGLEASHTWKDTFGDHPEWLADAASRYDAAYAWEVYRVIPIHPHNMPLQIWAETGMIGACLAASFLFLLGWRLKAPQDWSPVSRYAAAGLAGASTAIASFAYSMWNEAFWASAVIAAAVILLQARHDGAAKA